MLRLSRLVRTSTLAITLAFAGACGGDDDSPTNPGGGGSNGNTLTASVAGTAFTPLAVQGARANNFVTISATGTQGSIQLTVNNATGPGTFQLTGASNGAWSQLSGTTVAGTWASAATGGSGSVTFTTLTSAKAIGTFSFTGAGINGATGTRAVTNGSFNVNLLAAGGQ